MTFLLLTQSIKIVYIGYIRVGWKLFTMFVVGVFILTYFYEHVYTINLFHMNKMVLLLDLLDLGAIFHVPKTSLCCQNWTVVAPVKVPNPYTTE